MVGCVDIGLVGGTISVIPLGVDSSGDGSPKDGISCTGDGMNAGRALANSFWIVRCGRRLNRLPPSDSSSNLLASSRLWKANASSGESAGGMLPVCGGVNSLRGVYIGCASRSGGVEGRSMCRGRSAIVG